MRKPHRDPFPLDIMDSPEMVSCRLLGLHLTSFTFEEVVSVTCGLDEEWWDCKPKCHNTCPNFARAEACVDHPDDCESGCYCRDGLILDVDGSCVEPTDCED
ncbi:uncharacterized protein NPIL_484281, partial [Nephila pilipes]